MAGKGGVTHATALSTHSTLNTVKGTKAKTIVNATNYKMNMTFTVGLNIFSDHWFIISTAVPQNPSVTAWHSMNTS